MCSYKILNGGTTNKCRIPWQTSVMCLYFILALMKIASCEEMPSIRKFFPSLKNNLIGMTWAHEVVTEASFRLALREKKMMIVGDVKLKTEYNGKKKKETLCIINSYGSTGIYLDTFMQKAADAKSVAVKLNFHQISAFTKSVKVLQDMHGKLKFPLWLNLDTYNMEDKDVDKFLSLCTHNFPKATISIGMLHKGQTLVFERGYSANLVTQMKNALTRNNVNQTVAFPVKAGVAVNSIHTLPALKDVPGIIDSALYMYGFTENLLSINTTHSLKKLIKDFGKNRVYLDGPKNFVDMYI